MYIPTIHKIKYSNNVLIERALPSKGTVSAKIGDKVEPFTKFGISKVSYGVMALPEKIKFAKGKGDGSFIYSGKNIGSVGTKFVKAPFDGFISKTDEKGKYVLKQEERDFWLLSGVWGEITSVIKDRSVLIKSQTLDLHFAACTNLDSYGELIVFPNPSDALEMQYLDNFAKDVYGKVIYVGDFATEKFVKRAVDLGVSGVIAGGADRSSFNLAKQNNIFLGVFTGFGYEHIPDFIFSLLKEVSNRFVFIYGEKNLLRIPYPQPFSDSQVGNSNPNQVFRYVEKGLRVQVLQKPYFGWIGEVDRVTGSSIFVRFEEKKDIVEVSIPNILAID